MVGSVTNLGTQTYYTNGGLVEYGYINGVAIDGNPSIQYTVLATQSGLSTKGFGSIHFSATAGGTPFSVTGSFSIGGADPGAGLPAGCTTTCTQILPFDFIGSSNVQFTFGGSSQPVTMVVESPYWNPYLSGVLTSGAIYLVSMQTIPYTTIPLVTIVATYTQGTILWMGAQSGGSPTTLLNPQYPGVYGGIYGALGQTSVQGSFTLTTNEFENLVTGTATDSGTIQFNTNIPSLNARGTYSGSDTIPTAGYMDCTTGIGGDGIPGTCNLSGFMSNGHFKAGALSGGYSTTWGVPAYVFSSTVTATLSTGNSGNSGGFGGFGSFLNFLFHR